MKEIDKYNFIYSNPDQYRGYGKTNHGLGSLDLIKSNPPKSLLDVGCGFNNFCQIIKSKFNINAIGIDFACKEADIVCSALNLPFDNKFFDLITSFDMLEHLLPEEVPACLKELSRVSNRFIFSICYRPSVITCFGENLHPTVKNENWWINEITLAGGVAINKFKNFIYGDWKTL
jgi:SAM-dependent methyltransferase